ncbi:MAG: HD domain-containing protein [Thermodesulfovibrionales bacterium]|nr:HD domain-containing protein [Thermodesulfovibrionales bacterium]
MRRIFYINDEEDRSDESNNIKKSSLADFQAYIHNKEKFYQLDKNVFVPDKEVFFDIYLHKGIIFDKLISASQKEPRVLTRELLSLDGDYCIRVNDIGIFNEYLDSVFNSLLFSKEGKTLKQVVIKERTKLIVKDMLNNPKRIENIEKASRIVEELIDWMLNDKELIFDLISLKSYDYYTYTHSVNVEVLSMSLGIVVGLTKEEIFCLGLGSILHDIGKCFIPIEILNKAGKLTKREFEIIKNHVLESEKILNQHKNLPYRSKEAAIQHHEKLSGKGYPYGLKGKQISLYGMIASIVDCYDALVTERPYKKALTPFGALSLMVDEKDSFDLHILELFIKMLGRVI